MALNLTAQTGAVRWLSHGKRRFEHAGVVAIPATVAFDAERARLVIVVRAVSAGPFTQAPIDVLLARLAAVTVAGSLEHALPDFTVALYLRYTGDVDVPVEPELKETARLAEHRLEQLRHRAHGSGTLVPSILPAQVLANVLSRHLNPSEFSGRSRTLPAIAEPSEQSGWFTSSSLLPLPHRIHFPAPSENWSLLCSRAQSASSFC